MELIPLHGTVAAQSESKARMANLDAIRGLAVLGIFFLNIYFMGNPYYGYIQHQHIPNTDMLIEIFSNFFLEGRFISLFSILFGVGLLLQYQRFLAHGLDAVRLLKSRLFWLIVFGLIHGIFIWPGDILLTYGISGFLAMRYLSQASEQGNAAAIEQKAYRFILASLVVIFLISLAGQEPMLLRGSEAFQSQSQLWTSSYPKQLVLHVTQVAYMAIVIPLTLMWFTAGLMLLGMSLYHQGIFHRGFNRSQLLKLASVSLVLSILDSLLSFSGTPSLINASDVIVLMSAIPMALIYIHLMVKLCRNAPHRLTVLQHVGKLAFSLYILQSLFGVAVFRYLAPELIEHLDRFAYMAIAVGFSVCQLTIATFYFTYFTQGPLEHLWRTLAVKNR